MIDSAPSLQMDLNHQLYNNHQSSTMSSYGSYLGQQPQQTSDSANLQQNQQNSYSASSSGANRWNEQYPYYGSTDNYYRNLQYSQQNFHSPTYWLQAAVGSSEQSSVNKVFENAAANLVASQANQNWLPRATLPQNVHTPTSTLNNHANTSPYSYQIPGLNSTSLTASSLSSSASSSAANTPQLSSQLNTDLNKQSSDSYSFLTNSTSTASNLDQRMHSQLVNAYQNYTNNFNGLHYQHHLLSNNNSANNFYPPTPPKDKLKNETNTELKIENSLMVSPSEEEDYKKLQKDSLGNNCSTSSTSSSTSLDSRQSKKRTIDSITNDDNLLSDENELSNRLDSDEDGLNNNSINEDLEDIENEEDDDEENNSIEDKSLISPSNQNRLQSIPWSNQNSQFKDSNMFYNNGAGLNSDQKWSSTPNSLNNSSKLSNKNRKSVLPGKYIQ